MKTTLVLLILALCCTLHAQERPRVVDVSFVALNAANIGAAAFDVATTRRCIDAGTCHETNPLMQGGAARQYAQTFAIGAAVSAVSWKLKKNHSRAWWIPPVLNASAHLAAGFLNLRFSGRQP